MSFQPVMDKGELDAYVREVFPQADSYGWQVVEIRPGEITMSMKISNGQLRPGGTISGPTMFAMADICAYLVTLAHIGKVALAVTTSLNINFLNKPPHGDIIGHGRLIKLGRRLSVCEIHIHSSVDDTLVAQATATYSIPPR